MQNSTIIGKNLLVIGNSIASTYLPIFEELLLNTVLIGPKPKKQFLKHNDIKCHQIKNINADSIIELLDIGNFKPDLVFTASEEYIKIKAQVCKHFSLPFIPEEYAGRVVEKSEMRKIISLNDSSLVPGFADVESVQDIIDFINSYGAPVILKPSGLVRSLLVAKAESKEQAIEIYNEMNTRIHTLYADRLHSTKPKIIIEEYMEGPKYSVEGVVDCNGTPVMPDTVTDLKFGYDVEGIDDPLNYSRTLPSILSDEKVGDILDATRRVVKALDLRNCPIHAEMISTKNGVKLIEIAARIGGFREIMYSLSFGYSLVKADFEMQLTGSTSLNKTKQKYSAVVKVYAYEEAVLVGVKNEDKITKLPTYVSHVRKINDGNIVGPSKLGHIEIMFVVLCGNDRQQLMADHDYIFKSVRPITKKLQK